MTDASPTMTARILQHITTDSEATRRACERIFTNGTDDSATEIYHGARNTLYHITDSDSNHLCVKHFRKAKFPNSYVYTTLRRSKARRSFEHALRLLSLGFHTPRPIAWSERRKGLKLLDSYYICEFLPAANIRDWGKRADSEALIDALGAYMVSLHRAGVYHRDFSPGNILADRLADGTYRFSLVDINRMNFNVGNRAKLMSMFRSISLDEKDTMRLAKAYAKASGENPDTIAAEAIASLKKYQATKRRHRKLKKLFLKGG